VAETDLRVLLREMNPALAEGEYVFATAARMPEGADPVGTFREPEGLTLILPRAQAERLGLAFTFPCRMITLRVHSDLAAVGLLAAVTARLAAHGIAANAVSGYYHDHLFVPAAEAERALEALQLIEP